MGFIASAISSIINVIVDVIVGIVEAIVQIVETVILLIMVLLGYDTGGTQIVEYFEVRNYPLFNDVDKKNPVQQSILQAILSDKDIATNLIYNLAFRSLKGDVKEFMDFIEDGNYFEGFPALDSFILIINYTELTAALQTLTGVPCTAEVSALKALSQSDWIKYWLQENKEYDVGTNTMGIGNATTSTTAGTLAADTFQVIPSLNNFDVNITSESATSDAFEADQQWQVNLNTVVYNAVPDTYTVQVYNAAGTVRTLPYTVPTKPGELHYVSNYFRNSLPSRKYLFVYKVGAGTYTDLDTVEEPINLDNDVLQAIPDVPLRISNANYTTFGTTKKNQIEDLLAILNLDASEIIDGVMSDSGLAAGDLDHVYVKFGVRMWDTSQAGMSYLFTMFENLFPAQGTTQGTYNNTAASDTKPANNIHTTSADSNAAFQWNYITYTFTPLSTINASSGSTENGIYYSDMSKFGSDGLLIYPYYNSSGKGTYNVGYKADTLTEVAAFLAGNGTVNPGTTTTEAANWLQVTTRLPYNNPSPSLLESTGAASSLKFLTADAVYENNGSGVLRYVQEASEETTSGQSITYYCIKPNGLDAYTVAAPIAALRVVDGATGKFKTVKFNLGDKGDLMVPFIYTFVKGLSHEKVAKLFLVGAHVSIYVAHYEVIVNAGMSFLQALVMIIIIIVIIIIVIKTGQYDKLKLFLASVAGTATTYGVVAAIKVLLSKLATYAFKMIVASIIQEIIVEIVGDNELAMILGMITSIAIMSSDFEIGFDPAGAPAGSYGHTGGFTIGEGGGSLKVPGSVNTQGVYIKGSLTSGFSLPKSSFEYLNAGMQVMNTVGKFLNMRVQSMNEALDSDVEKYLDGQEERIQDLKSIQEQLNSYEETTSGSIINATRKIYHNANIGAELVYKYNDSFNEMHFLYNIDLQVDTVARNQFA